MADVGCWCGRGAPPIGQTQGRTPIVACDNTPLGPVFQRPIEHGADLSLYSELLKLRRDAELTREIITRLVEQYARTLQKRGLPLTSGSLYLAYFAGPAGAVTLLSGADHADAASVMAAADATGRTTRQKIVRANPFLEILTVGDLKNWANYKMRGI